MGSRKASRVPGLLVMSVESGTPGSSDSAAAVAAEQFPRSSRASGGAAFGRLSPSQQGIDQTAAADGDERQGHQEHQPEPPL